MKINIDPDSQYFLSRDGETTEGPFMVSQITKMWKSGTLPTTSQLCAENGDWFPAKALIEKADLDRQNVRFVLIALFVVIAIGFFVFITNVNRDSEILRNANKAAPPIIRSHFND